MLRQLANGLRKQVSTDARDASVCSKLLYASGLAIFVLSTLKIASLQVTEAQLVLGLLAAVCASMLTVMMGLLLEIRAGLQKATARQPVNADRGD
jgi:hypothetical protein